MSTSPLSAPVVNNGSQQTQTYYNVLQYLTKHGYTQWTRYQPGSRFWPFQRRGDAEHGEVDHPGGAEAGRAAPLDSGARLSLLPPEGETSNDAAGFA